MWIAGRGGMVLALFIGHIELGIAQTVKSFIGWMKGWALIAVYVYVGATMRIRPALIYRASNILALVTLILTPIFVLAGTLRLPTMYFVSPLVVLGGSGTGVFLCRALHRIAPDTGMPRWSFYAPWAPAAALLANVALVFAAFDRDVRWRAIGIVSALAVCYSRSRAWR